jgi:zinc protease
MLMGQAESVGAGWRRIDQFVERIRAVTAKDIQRVAKQYLTQDNRTVGILIPIPSSSLEPAHTAVHDGKS